MNRLITLLAPGVFALSSVASGCGEPFAYVGGGGQSSTASGSSSTSSSGGSGGEISSSSGSSTSSGGTGGAPECAPGSIGACGSGKYCSSETSTCEPCGELTRFRFGTPTLVPMSPSTAGTNALFPRVSPDDGALLFTYADKSGPIPRPRIVSAPFVPATQSWGAWSLSPAPINSPEEDSGALYLNAGGMLKGLVGGKVDTAKAVVLFDSSRAQAGTRALYVANPGAPEASPLALAGGKRDSEIAAAPDASPPRFYWMSGDSALTQRLVTATGASTPASVKMVFENGCSSDVVQGPWISRDGKLLLFGAAPPSGATCTPSSVLKRLYVARMNDQGVQVATDAARPIFPDDGTSFDSTPSLSPDACFLLFARFTPHGQIMIAARD